MEKAFKDVDGNIDELDENGMVKVVLFEDGTYKVSDVNGKRKIQKLNGVSKGKKCELYFCNKDKWKEYLLKLISESINRIDEELSKLQKNRKVLVELKNRISKEIESK